jgi:hypothetical protein
MVGEGRPSTSLPALDAMSALVGDHRTVFLIVVRVPKAEASVRV